MGCTQLLLYLKMFQQGKQGMKFDHQVNKTQEYNQPVLQQYYNSFHLDKNRKWQTLLQNIVQRYMQHIVKAWLQWSEH